MSTNIESPARLSKDHSLYTADMECRTDRGVTVLSGQQRQLQLTADCRGQVRAAAARVSFMLDHRDKSPASAKFVDLQRGAGKRHSSFSADDRHPGSKQRRYSDRFGTGSAAYNFRKRGGRGGRFHPVDRGERIVLPTKFLLGGNITDPLNLNSLMDEAVNKYMNQNTPISSPLPVPVHKLEVPVRKPANFADPLNLNNVNVDIADEQSSVNQSWSMFKKRRKRNRKQTKSTKGELTKAEDSPPVKPLHVETESKPEDRSLRHSKETAEAVADVKAKRVIDHIVSPVIPQMSPKWKRRRTASESRGPEVSCELKPEQVPDRQAPVRHKKRSTSQTQQVELKPTKFKALNWKFSYGNYNPHIVSRNVLGYYVDPRLGCFSTEMFAGKDVLDIGCNVGHVTLSIASEFSPHRVVGVDIDGQLIAAAKKNLNHYFSATVPDSNKFPVGFRTMFGPLAVPGLLHGNSDGFPHNVKFIQSDYVPKSDSHVDEQLEEYDVILALNITKWIHLNNGDSGLKRAFRRMYRQLRPGGMLLIEIQPWDSYRKKKKLTHKFLEMFKLIKFYPNDFRSYLLSEQVGFASCHQLKIPSNKHKSWRHTIHVFKKVTPGTPSSLPAATSLTSCRLPSTDCVFDRERDPLNLNSVHGSTPDDTASSSCCSWLTPQFRIGSASCSTTPCCSTHCRNTPSVEDCSREDFNVYSSSFYLNTTESSLSPTDSLSRDAQGSSTFVPTNEDSESTGEPIAVSQTQCTDAVNEDGVLEPHLRPDEQDTRQISTDDKTPDV